MGFNPRKANLTKKSRFCGRSPTVPPVACAAQSVSPGRAALVTGWVAGFCDGWLWAAPGACALRNQTLHISNTLAQSTAGWLGFAKHNPEYRKQPRALRASAPAFQLLVP